MQSYIQYLSVKAARKKIPLNGTFELLPCCNLACKMCYVRLTPEEIRASGRRLMSLDEWLLLAKNAVDQGMVFLLLTGGEPLLYPDFPVLYKKLAQMGLLLSINTNGTLINDELIALWKKYPPRSINVTLYGLSDDEYESLCGRKKAYTTVFENILRLQKEGIVFRVNFSVLPDNKENVKELISLSKKYGLPLNLQEYIFPPVRRQELTDASVYRMSAQECAQVKMKSKKLRMSLESYRGYCAILAKKLFPWEEEKASSESGQERQKVQCNMGKSSFWVSWDGRLFGCGMVPVPVIEESQINFDSAWKELTRKVDQLLLNDTCARCSFYENCHPCAAKTLAETGKINGKPEYCCKTMEAMRAIAIAEMKKQI